MYKVASSYKKENDGIYRDRETLNNSYKFFDKIFKYMQTLGEDDPLNLPKKYGISEIKLLPFKKYVIIQLTYE